MPKDIGNTHSKVSQLGFVFSPIYPHFDSQHVDTHYFGLSVKQHLPTLIKHLLKYEMLFFLINHHVVMSVSCFAAAA